MENELPLWKRIAWMIAIWAASVVALGVVAGLIRVVLKTGTS